jgi:hypothetical protein
MPPRLAKAGERFLGWLARRWPLLVVVAFALLLHLPLLFAPVGGFHAYNEGFYANRARVQAVEPVLQTVLRPADLNNMPLFTWLLTIVVKIVGSAEWAIRLPSLAAALISVFLVGLLAEELIGSEAAVPAALFLTLMPVHLLVGNNAQPDMMMVALALAGVLAYVRSYRSSEMGLRVLSGALFGLAALTKLNALLFPAAIALWETARRRDLKWLGRRSALAWVAAAAALPVAWGGAQILFGGGGIVRTQSRLAGIAQVPNPAFLRFFLVELPFQLGLVITAAALVGLVTLRSGRWPRVRLAAWMAAASVVFFLFYHFHSYYLFPLAPAAPILAAASLGLATSPRQRTLIVVAMVALTLPFTLYYYEFKIPQESFRGAAAWMLERGGPRATLLLPVALYENNGEVLRYYLPDATIRTLRPGELAPSPSRFVAYLSDAGLPADSVHQSPVSVKSLVLFGTAYWPWFESTHNFHVTDIHSEAVQPYRVLGIADHTLHDFNVVDISALTSAQAASFEERWLATGGTF